MLLHELAADPRFAPQHRGRGPAAAHDPEVYAGVLRRPRLRGGRLGDDVPARAAPARTRCSPGSAAPAPARRCRRCPTTCGRRSSRSTRRCCARPTRRGRTARRCRSAGSSWWPTTMRLHHVQVSCPPGGEDAARRFYGEGLGLPEVAKPPELAARGGCWFRDEAVEVHVGVEPGFSPARKAHPAFLVEDLDATVARLAERGFPVDRSEEHTFPGHRRVHTADGSGNRVELLAVSPVATYGSVGYRRRVSTPLSQTQMLQELEPVVEENLNRHLSMAKEWFPHEYVPWSEGRTYDGPLGGEPWKVDDSAMTDVARVGADRQPAHRGQPPQLPPRDRDAVRARRRVGRLGAPLDRRGGSARHRDPRLPARHPVRRPDPAGAAADAAHVDRLLQRPPRRHARLAGLRVVPGARDPGLAPQHRPGDRRPGRRPAARPRRRRREPPHGLLPQPARRGARDRRRTRRCARSPTW